MRKASFHLAIRSLRAKEPTLSCPTPQPTARCTIVTSSVSPDRAETMPARPDSCAARQAANVSVSVPALVRLQQHGRRGAARRRFAHPFRVGHEEIVTHDLHARSQLAGERREARGVVLGQRILDRTIG